MKTQYFRTSTVGLGKKITSLLLSLVMVAFLFAMNISQEQSAHASSPDTPIMGSSQLTGAQIADWYRSRRGNNWPLTNISLNELANLYVSEGNLIGIRGDVAFAQAIHETGWFGSPCSIHKNNYSGIGAAGPCMNDPSNGGGYIFETRNGVSGPRRSVRAQLHQLRNYSDHSRVETWVPAPEFSRNGFVHKPKAGDAVRTWMFLNGRYAVPGTTYAQTIFNNYYNPMLKRFGINGYCSEAPPEEQQTSGTGYWVATPNGGVKAFGEAKNYGSMAGLPLNAKVLGMAPTGTGNGYWLVASDGGIFSYGDAQFYGSTGSIKLNKPVVGMASTPSGKGYWMVASDGGIFSYGDANFYGSTGSIKLNKPIVGMAPTESGKGYWLVASDGGIFSFGDARFHGSTGSQRLNEPIVDMAARPQGDGYWLVAKDGAVFSFGKASFKGSWSGCGGRTFTSIEPTPSGNGYYMGSTDGRVAAFGDAKHFGSSGSNGIGLASR